MDQESREKYRLSAQEQEEIGDILMSARAVSHQMIAQAQEKIDAMLADRRRGRQKGRGKAA